MNESLADIEALSLRCSSEESKDYISEATLCYRVGAYRAAIVSTWIAVVFDLIDKIRELSLAGDHAARELEDKFQKYIDQINEGNRQGITKGLEFEREILTTCREIAVLRPATVAGPESIEGGPSPVCASFFPASRCSLQTIC